MSDTGRGYQWTEEYREIIDFYFWEPQHLGRIKNSLSTIQDSEAAWTRASGLEVATNQVLDMYLGMVPLETLDPEGRHFPLDTYEHVGGRALEDLVRALRGITQPDGYFQGHAHDVALELKTRRHSSVDQVQKYVLFHSLVGQRPPLTLVYLTKPTTVSRLFGIDATTLGDVQDAVAATPLPSRLSGLVDPAAWSNAVRSWHLVALTYTDVHALVLAASAREASPVARRVHQGLACWLEERGLVTR